MRWRGLSLGAACAFLASVAAAQVTVPTPPVPLVLPFDKLPAATPAGQMIYVIDCRAIVSVSGLALVTQAAGAGTGCLATSNGTVWQIDGTTILVSK